MTDRETVSRWLSGYVSAWNSYSRDEIVALFTSDAIYRYYPEDDPMVGAAAIADSWLEDRDDPGSWSASYEVFAVDGDRAVATGITHYVHPDGSPKASFHNVFLMTFDESGRCGDFSEYYHKVLPSGASTTT